MRTYFRIIRYLKPYRKEAIFYLILILLSILFGLLSFISIVPLLKVIFEKNTEQVTQPDFHLNPAVMIQWLKFYVNEINRHFGKLNALGFICVFAISATFLKNIFLYFAQRNLASLRAFIIRDLRMEMFDKLSRLHISYFRKRKKGDIISRLTSDVQEIENSVVSTLNIIFREPVTIIIFYAVLFGISWKLTLITLILIPLSALIIGRIAKRLKAQSSLHQESLGKLLSLTDETIMGTRIIKAFNAQSYVIEKFRNENNFYTRLFKSIMFKKDLASPFSEFMGVAVICVIIWYGGREIFNETGGLAPEDFIGYIIIYTQILTPAKAFTSAISTIQKGIASAERIFNLTDAPVIIRNKPKPVTINSFERGIEFKNLTFAYENIYTLRSINLYIPKGRVLALVGPSGGGKSTLADMVPRFYDPLMGDILIDDISIRELELNSVRALMGIVTQEPILFNDTLLNNISFGQPHITEEQIINAAKIANAHDFIVKLPNGYHTNIGDRGQKLSGGEKQRVSIARAILKNPPILILDEATSSLDSESEKLVQDAIYKLMENRTCIVIAHRLSTIQHAHEIVVIEKGEIVQRGVHDELMQVEGVYRRLSRLQGAGG
ncbi:MAG: antibiotic ABC transporter ATP-binding protein [Bacteroidetes bacterium RIFCSPLOWO2_12_FULL_37_12]|nr:MAG: antibiotic ABC transporter ATP-binding protein [Bacteroidetes bacterium RIFCSPLOWO2_12_FULL_37_12]